MAKYDVAKRFQEVAKKAKEVGPIHTGPSKKKKVEPEKPRILKPEGRPKNDAAGEYAYDTRPGKVSETLDFNEMQKVPLEKRQEYLSHKRVARSRDVNLPISTASPDVHKRMAELRAMRKK